MAKLTTKKRDSLKSATFGLPADKKYPITDKAHATDAKSRATQQFDAGNLSGAQRAQVDRKADAKLGEKPKTAKKTKPRTGGGLLGY